MYQKILTKTDMKAIPPLYAQEKMGGAAKIAVKFFTPDAGATWWVTEGGPIVRRIGMSGEENTLELQGYKDVLPGDEIVDWMFFGMVDLGMGKELGYFNLAELKKVKGKLGLPIERDMHFHNKTLKDVAPEMF